MKTLKDGMSQTPPRDPWGINFGGGLNSTALIIEARRRGMNPDWILFADTGSEMPGTLEHVERMAKWCEGWCEVTTVRWDRKKPVEVWLEAYQIPEGLHKELFRDETQRRISKTTGRTEFLVKKDIGFEPLHENCLRTNHLPSKAYGLAGCTSKWKIQPMDRWRKQNGLQEGAFAVGYDSDEHRRITSACKRGDQPGFTAWYPLVAWGIGRQGCNDICKSEGIEVGKSSCFMCPNMRNSEWKDLYENNRELFDLAQKIEDNARENGNFGRGSDGLLNGGLSSTKLSVLRDNFDMPDLFDLMPNALEDRCHHGGCFT